MTVRHNAVITCNQCGKQVTLPTSGSLTGYLYSPPGWLTIESTEGGFTIGNDTPEQGRNRRPDLCSWDCVMLYASEEAISRKEKQERASPSFPAPEEGLTRTVVR